MTDMMPKDATIFDDIKYQKQLITVATSIFAIREDKLAVLLVKRNKEPFFGQWMFPGGGVYNDESCEDAVKRELNEKLSIKQIHPHLAAVFSDPKRDPRFRNITIAYWCLVVAKKFDFHKSVEKFSAAEWIFIDEVKSLAFDHIKILKSSLTRLQDKVYDIAYMKKYLPSPFTLSQLQKIYESILGVALDKRNFRRKLNSLNCLEPTGEKNMSDTRKKSLLYTFK